MPYKIETLQDRMKVTYNVKEKTTKYPRDTL